MADAQAGRGIYTDAAMLGVRLALGVTFVYHGLGKFNNPGYEEWMSSAFGLGPEVSLLVALGEFVPGVLLIPGVLSRISSAIIALIMLAAMIFVLELASFASVGETTGYEHDLILLAAALLVMVAGPGRVSLARVVPLPRLLH